MAHGRKICACCGGGRGASSVKRFYLLPKHDGCPSDLTVWLCRRCHKHALIGQMNEAPEEGDKRLTKRQLEEARRIAENRQEGKLIPALKETSHLAPLEAAAEIECRGLGRLTHEMILRARENVGLKQSEA